MHVVCVCVELQAFCIFGLNCLLAGRSDALRAMTFDRHKVVMDITFAAWCEVNIEFAELLFFVKLFGFDMSERMSEDMSESMSKDMSERMSERMSKDMSERCQKEYRKICQKICQKECQKICQKKCQKDMSEDMSERTSEDCFQSVCEVESNRTHFRR